MDTTMDTPLILSARFLNPIHHRAKSQRNNRTLFYALGIVLALASWAGAWFHTRYGVADSMRLPLKELSTADYPENPANRSVDYGRYANRSLKLIRKDATHFDFILRPSNPHTAAVCLRNIDVSLMVASRPSWISGNRKLEKIALTDREWNRQQVAFTRDSGHVEVTGGNGFESENLYSAELANNSLSAGLWEILLYTNEGGGKKLYYQGWFTFPLGHYKKLFEGKTHLNYWSYWRRIEHWTSPEGTLAELPVLREVKTQRQIPAKFLVDENILAAGEQLDKMRTVIARNLVTWRDFFSSEPIRFAAFVSPGRYDVKSQWRNEYWKISRLDKVFLRNVVSPADRTKTLQELELVFEDGRGHTPTRLVVSGFDLKAIPQLGERDYPKGFSMPMGISVPPTFQSYGDLQKNPPERSPYFSLLLDAEDRYLDHREVGLDGPIMYRDAANPKILHLYLLSYERQSLIAHYALTL